MAKKISSRIEKQICIEYQDGFSTGELATKYGVSRHTIRQKLQKNNIKLTNRSKTYKFSIEEENQICNEFQEGTTSKRLAEKFNCSTMTISGVLKRGGIGKIVTRKNFSKEELEEICDEYRYGVSAKELAEKYDVSPQTIRRYLKNNGVALDRVRSSSKFTVEQEKKICDDYENGLRPKELAAKYNVHEMTIGKILKRNSVKIKKRKITVESEKKICKLYQEGQTTKNLAQEYNVSRNTILRYLKKNNVEIINKPGRKGSRVSSEEEKQICLDYLDGLSSVELGNKYNRNPNTIFDILKRNDIQPRKGGRNGKINEKDEKAIFNAYNLGASTQDLADKYNVTSMAIYNLLKKSKIDIRKRGEHVSIFNSSDENEICKLYESGLTSVKIAERYNCNANSIINLLQRNGIKIRKHNIFDEYEEEQICTNYLDGFSVLDMAKTYECSFLTIYAVLDKYNIERKEQKGESHHNWKGGISFEPYCPKFNEEFKERVRKFWNRNCGICGLPENEKSRRLSVHHVNYEKMVCCNDTPPLFIPLCSSCHTRTNNNRIIWENYLTSYIMIWFNGESYNPK